MPAAKKNPSTPRKRAENIISIRKIADLPTKMTHYFKKRFKDAGNKMIYPANIIGELEITIDEWETFLSNKGGKFEEAHRYWKILTNSRITSKAFTGSSNNIVAEQQFSKVAASQTGSWGSIKLVINTKMDDVIWS